MIDEFNGRYSFLSNFYESPLIYDGMEFRNSESAYQSAKVIDIQEKMLFQNTTASQGKKLGRGVKLRSDWEEIKDDVMLEVVRCKFTQNRILYQKLLDTGVQELVEGNWWGDTYWGVYRGHGQNKLGKILMQVRQEIRNMEMSIRKRDSEWKP